MCVSPNACHTGRKTDVVHVRIPLSSVTAPANVTYLGSSCNIFTIGKEAWLLADVQTMHSIILECSYQTVNRCVWQKNTELYEWKSDRIMFWGLPDMCKTKGTLLAFSLVLPVTHFNSFIGPWGKFGNIFGHFWRDLHIRHTPCCVKNWHTYLNYLNLPRKANRNHLKH